jgi:hypothetical protein
MAGMLLAASSGCASTTAVPSPTSEHSAPATTAEADPALAPPPALAFDGSCESVIDDSTLSDLVGATVVRQTAEQSERVLAVAVLGGLDCSWVDESGEAYIWLDVLPVAGLEERAAHAEEGSPQCYGGDVPEQRCTFSAVVGGYWFSGIVGVAAGSGESALDAIDALSARLAETAAGTPAVAATHPIGIWGSELDCASFGSTVDTAGILGSPFAADTGSLGGEVTPGFIGALDEVGDVPCVWAAAGDARWFTSEVLPGAGWAITEFAARDGAASVTVDGALEAIALSPGGDVTNVYATDGTNLAWVSTPPEIDQDASLALLSGVMTAASR